MTVNINITQLIEAAKKDLEFVNKAQEAHRIMLDLGIVSDDEHMDVGGLIRDCKNKLEALIANPIEELQEEHNSGDSLIENGKWTLTHFTFYTEIYDNTDFDLTNTWSKLIKNTKEALDSMGLEVMWATKTCSGFWPESIGPKQTKSPLH
jgi:hypothetical protein